MGTNGPAGSLPPPAWNGGRTLRIQIEAWERVDLLSLAALTYAVKQDEMEIEGDRAIGAISDWLCAKFAQQTRMAVLALLGSELMGYLMLVVQNPARVEINPWFLGGHPLVAPEQDQRTLGSRLLREAVAWAGDEGFECVELSVDQDVRSTRHELEAQKAWYQSLGFYVREEHVGLLYTLANQERPGVALPSGFELQSVLEVNQEALYRCYYDAFNAGQSGFFFDQSERERRAHFDTFGKLYGIVEETSMALLHTGQIVAFTFVMPVNKTHVHLDWMGVHPDYRRRGLARFLLEFVINGSAAQGVQTMSLSCDIGNTRALELYRSSGWQEMELGLTYAAKTGAGR